MESTASSVAIMLVIMLLIIIPAQNNRRMMMKRLIAKKEKGDKSFMKEFAQKLLDKKCIFYLFNGSQIAGFIKEVTDSGILVDSNGNTELLNLDFVMRIREVPKNKKGEYKNTFC